MPTEYRILGAISSITANTLTTLYTVPAGKQAVISSILVGSGYSTFSPVPSSVQYGICIRQAGAAQTAAQYIAMNNTFVNPVRPVSPGLPGSSYGGIGTDSGEVAIVAGITLSATDVISVSAAATGITFHCFGSQIVP